MFSGQNKMAELMASDARTLQIVSRFSIPLGVGDRTVEDVCTEHSIHTDTFLSIVNHIQDGHRISPAHIPDIDTPTLMVYLRNAHQYFLNYQLPRIRQELIEAISAIPSGTNDSDNSIPLLIIRFYDEYVEEVKTHIRHEDENAFQHHEDDDMHVAEKLSELKNLIIRYYPANEQNTLLYAALQDIFLIEQELSLHCSIEDHILLPVLSHIGESNEGLTAREQEVLIELVKGRSNKEMADRLNLSIHTIISHRKNIVRKLGIHSAAGLTIYAIVNHLVSIDSLEQHVQ